MSRGSAACEHGRQGGLGDIFFPALVFTVVSHFAFFGGVRLGRRREGPADLFPGGLLAPVHLMRHFLLSKGDDLGFELLGVEQRHRALAGQPTSGLPRVEQKG